MNNKKKMYWLPLVIVVLFIAAWLVFRPGHDKPGGNTEGTPPSQSTIIVQDYLGRTVEVPARIERVACLYAFTGHVTSMLGQSDKIVAVPEGLKRDVLLNQMFPSIGQALVPSSDESINIEELLKADPDVVFVKRDTGGNPAEIAKMDKFKIPYVVVDFTNIQEQQQAIQLIGQVFGVPEQAAAYNEYYQESLARVDQAIKAIPTDKRVRVYHSVNEATRTDTPGTLPADWLGRAGAINVALDQPLRLVEGKYFASLEQILLWDAEVILANEPGVAGYILTNPQWSPLKAVQNKRVFQMPIGISRWGHPGGLETPLAVLWTAHLLYPEECKDIDMKQESKDFYVRFFNYTVSDTDIDKILKGERMRGKRGETI